MRRRTCRTAAATCQTWSLRKSTVRNADFQSKPHSLGPRGGPVNTILDRYFAAEVGRTAGAVLLILLLIFISNRVIRYLAEAAAGELPGSVIVSLTAFKGLGYLILLMPLAVYLAVLLVMGRMYRDQEMTALAACGIGAQRLYRPLFYVALPLGLALAGLSLTVVPWADSAALKLADRAKRQMEITAVGAGRFQSMRQGRRVFFAERVVNQRLENVFIQVQEDPPVTVTAERGYFEQREDSGDRYLVLEQGVRYEGHPGEREYRVIEFERHGILLRLGALRDPARKLSARSSSALWHSGEADAAAELQWRISVPVSLWVLAALAVPLARAQPRSGRYGRLFVAVVIYVAYVNLLAASQAWVEQQRLPPELGLWWVHGAMAALAAVLVWRQHRYMQRRRWPRPRSA